MFTIKADAISTARSNVFPDVEVNSEEEIWTLVQLADRSILNKALTTQANVYIPEDLVGQTINFTIIGGCERRWKTVEGTLIDDWRNSGRDLNPTAGDTVFIAGRGRDRDTSDEYKRTDLDCTSNTQNNLSITLEADPAYASGSTDGYLKFRIFGMAFGSESNQYINAFRFRADTPGVLLGASDLILGCDRNSYPLSCPSDNLDLPINTTFNNRSYTYSSFWGGRPTGQGQDLYSVDFGIQPCENGRAFRGSIFFYDLDASDTSLNDKGQNLEIALFRDQNFNNVNDSGTRLTFDSALGPQDRLPEIALQNWTLGWRPFGIEVIKEHPGYGANEDQFLLLPPKNDDTFDALADFDPAYEYTLRISGVSKDNAIQFYAPTEDCPDPVQPPTCTAGTITRWAGRAFRAVSNLDNPNDEALDVTRANYRINAPSPRNTDVALDGNNPNRNTLPARQQNQQYRTDSETITTPGTYNIDWTIETEAGDATCRGTIIIRAQATCTVPNLSIMAGALFTTRAGVANPNAVDIEVTTANYKINAPSPRDTNVTLDGNNPNRNVLGSNVTDQPYVSNGERVTTPGTYTISWTITTVIPGDITCSSTLTILQPPTFDPAGACANVSAITIDPIRPFLVNFDINTNSVDWPDGTSTGGLHVAVTNEGNTNWDANWAVADPPPDASSPFRALDSGGGQTLVNVTRYDDPTANVAHRYYVNNPEASGNTTVRIRPPATTGDYTLVLRLYDKTNNIWFPSRCEIPVEVRLLPLTCTSSYSTGLFQVNVRFDATATVSNPNLVNVPLRNVRYDTNPALLNDEFGDGTAVAPAASGGNNGSIPITVNDLIVDIDDAGDYQFIMQQTYTEKNGSPNINRTIYCDDTNGGGDTLSFQLYPYVKLYGNDIFAGGGFTNDQQVCEATSAAAIRSAVAYTAVDDATNSYFQGASAELAVFAVNQIKGIRPFDAQPPAVTDLDALSRLAFANTGNDSGGNPIFIDSSQFILGGGFGQTICSTNWWQGREGDIVLPATPAPEVYESLNLSAYNGEQRSLIVESDDLTNGTLTIYATDLIEDGTRLTLYVDGDIAIGRSSVADTRIAFENSSWPDAESVPSLFIIARGNIYVDDTITRLDGVYVAQPDPDNLDETGEIHTCSFYNLGLDLVDAYTDGNGLASQRLADRCNRKLVIEGAFVAKRVELLRTNGTVSAAAEDEDPFDSANQNVAEVFRFNPLLYIVGGEGVPRAPTLDQVPVYESILSLPPNF